MEAIHYSIYVDESSLQLLSKVCKYYILQVLYPAKWFQNCWKHIFHKLMQNRPNPAPTDISVKPL